MWWLTVLFRWAMFQLFAGLGFLYNSSLLYRSCDTIEATYNDTKINFATHTFTQMSQSQARLYPINASDTIDRISLSRRAICRAHARANNITRSRDSPSCCRACRSRSRGRLCCRSSSSRSARSGHPRSTACTCPEPRPGSASFCCRRSSPVDIGTNGFELLWIIVVLIFGEIVLWNCSRYLKNHACRFRVWWSFHYIPIDWLNSWLHICNAEIKLNKNAIHSSYQSN